MAEEELENDDDLEEGGDVEEKGGSGGGKLVLLIGLINTIGLLAIGAYVILGGGGGGTQPMAPIDPAVAQAIDDNLPGAPERPKGGPGPLVELGVLVVNLKEPTGDRYLKAKINLELDGEDTRGEVEARMSAIKYQLTMLLSGQRVADVQGPEAMESLRKSMKRRANAVLAKGSITEVWPEEWIVQ